MVNFYDRIREFDYSIYKQTWFMENEYRLIRKEKNKSREEIFCQMKVFYLDQL